MGTKFPLFNSISASRHDENRQPSLPPNARRCPVVQCPTWTLINVLIAVPTCPVVVANAAPRTFTLARALWLLVVPDWMNLIFGRVSLNVPVLWEVSRFVITVHVAVTSPPGIGLHVGSPVFGSKVQNVLEKTSGEILLVSTLSESV